MSQQQMVTEYCIDNNILVRYFAPDEADASVDLLISKIQREDKMICAPALVNYEFANAIGRKVKMKIMDEEGRNAALKAFFDLPIILMWSQETIEATMKLVAKGFPSTYDASYLAVAMTRKIPLVTLDKDFYKRAKSEYHAVFRPEQLV